MGDRFMLPYDYPPLTPLEVQQQFGSRFAEALLELEPGWHGPIASGYGLHLVHVSERLESELPDYRDIRDRLVVDFNRDRSERARDALYEGLRANYTVQVDEAALQGAALASPGG
jgi:parvulin-like peptidyl-prolyl isomerase